MHQHLVFPSGKPIPYGFSCVATEKVESQIPRAVPGLQISL